MRGTILQNSLIILIASLMMLLMVGCPKQTTQQPAPQSGDTPPGQPAAEMTAGQFGEVLINCNMAIAEGDFETARTWCTESFYEANIKPLEDNWAHMTDDGRERLREDFSFDEEHRSRLMDAQVEVSGNEATVTVAEPDGATTVLGYLQMDGDWKLNSIDWTAAEEEPDPESE